VAVRARDKRIDGPAIARMLEGIEAGEDGLRFLPEVDFAGATFVGPVDFSKVHFGTAIFRAATFEGDAMFEGAHFDHKADFACAAFEGKALFERAVFGCEAIFEFVERAGDEPDDETDETGAGSEVTFADWADFRRVRFEAGAVFGGARFQSRARFVGTSFGSRARPAGGSFVGASFSAARTFGPMMAWGPLSLDRVAFDAPVRIRLSAPEVTCRDAQFRARTTMEIRFARVDLSDSEFALPSVVGGFAAAFPEKEYLYGWDWHLAGWVKHEYKRGWRPQISSLDRANVGSLTLSSVDLTACRFGGAHNLDGLRFEGADFPTIRNVWRFHRSAAWEELRLSGSKPAEAERIARVYRALRKGREDNKDEPGAADFYYGEMEMRRKARRRRKETGSAKRTSRIEWLVLWAYKLVSGYGLRSSRALGALVVTVVFFAVLLDRVSGFDPDQGFWKSLLFSAESTSGLFRAPRPPDGATLNDEGHIFQMGLRLFGPLFFGLALLALRGRVKR
jgi:uncharacterized protein YjbI with pentapeptide repeats